VRFQCAVRAGTTAVAENQRLMERRQATDTARRTGHLPEDASGVN